MRVLTNQIFITTKLLPELENLEHNNEAMKMFSMGRADDLDVYVSVSL